MKAIYKYPVGISDEIQISIPQNAEILCVQMQYDTPCIWALVDKTAINGFRYFRWYGTGHPVKDNPGKYIGTVQMNGGSLVFHLFEEE